MSAASMGTPDNEQHILEELRNIRDKLSSLKKDRTT